MPSWTLPECMACAAATTAAAAAAVAAMRRSRQKCSSSCWPCLGVVRSRWVDLIGVDSHKTYMMLMVLNSRSSIHSNVTHTFPNTPGPAVPA
jgi:hypothetical protein